MGKPEDDKTMREMVSYREYQELLKRSFYENREAYPGIRAIIEREKYAGVIFYPSPILWDIPLFQRPHQLLLELSKKNYLVFFLTPDPVADRAEPIREINRNLYLIQSINTLYDFRNEPLILYITWTPSMVCRNFFPKSTVIYDWIDELDVFTHYSLFMEIDHRKLLLSADVVLTSAGSLLEKAKALRKDALLVPNGVRVEDFRVDREIVPDDILDIVSKGKSVAGFFGLLADWRMDYDLVNYLSGEMKDINFVFIGPSYDRSSDKITRTENIFLLGPKPYDTLKYYLHHFDVALIPYTVDRITNSVFPVKLCEYLAGGKPVVSTSLPECKKFRSVFVSETFPAFRDAIRKALTLKDDERYLRIVLEEAEANTWEMRAEKIAHALESHKSGIPPRHISAEEELSFTVKEVNAQEGVISFLLREGQNLKSEMDRLRARLLEKESVLAEKEDVIAQQEDIISVKDSALAGLEKRLASMLTSKTWKLGQLYGRLFYHTKINKLAESLFHRIVERRKGSIGEDEETALTKLRAIVNSINGRGTNGVFILTSAFEFDEFYNQRVISLSKYLSQRDYAVIYVAWRWTRDSAMKGLGEEVYPNIFQIPVDYLFDHSAAFKNIAHDKKYFVIELPHPDFFLILLSLQEAGYTGYYDIIDEWEEFHKVNQAPWFEKEYEEAIVLNADVVTAVSSPLKIKFSSLRTDISLIPNGFSPSLLGEKADVSGQTGEEGGGIDVGYFGHLTDSWFDWDRIFVTAEKNEDFRFHIIGYGESDKTRAKVSKYGNIRLYGKVYPSALHQHVKDWDVAILPFRNSPLSNAADPLKIYEYLYFGLPVVVQGIPHLGGMPYVINTVTAHEFQTAIREFAAKKRKNEIAYQEVEEFLKVCTWEERFNEMLNLLERHGE